MCCYSLTGRDAVNFRTGQNAQQHSVGEEASILFRAYCKSDARKFMRHLGSDITGAIESAVKVYETLMKRSNTTMTAATAAEAAAAAGITRYLLLEAERVTEDILINQYLCKFKTTSKFMSM